MKSIEDLDRLIGGVVKNWTSRLAGDPHARELLEVRRDILNDIRDRVEPKGDGESIFPYNNVSIHIGAPQRDLFEAAFEDIGGEIRQLLTDAHCRLAPDFAVAVDVTEDAAGPTHHVSFARRKTTAKSAVRPPAMLTVLKGEAEPAQLEISSDRVNLGRLHEVVGKRDGLRRRNDIAFADSETTVSREHAYVRFDAASGKFRLYDHLSQRGTAIFREGRRIEVSKGSLRGVQLQPGDEIHLGEARIRFEQ